MTFKKKFGVYADKILLNRKTLENWQTHENGESNETILDLENFAESVPGKLVLENDKAKIETDFFQLDFVFTDEIPEDYYRLIKTSMCMI